MNDHKGGRRGCRTPPTAFRWQAAALSGKVIDMLLNDATCTCDENEPLCPVCHGLVMRLRRLSADGLRALLATIYALDARPRPESERMLDEPGAVAACDVDHRRI